MKLGRGAQSVEGVLGRVLADTNRMFHRRNGVLIMILYKYHGAGLGRASYDRSQCNIITSASSGRGLRGRGDTIPIKAWHGPAVKCQEA